MGDDEKNNKISTNLVKKLEKANRRQSIISSPDYRDFLPVLETLFIPSYIPEKVRKERTLAAYDQMRSIKPSDSLERMLAVQMVSVHHAAMECLRRASLEDQTKEAREANLNQAGKLTGLFTRQMEALDKHRGKGQQKVTVEHVHVESGAQAVVGSVHTGGHMVESRPVNVEAPVSKAPRQRGPLRSRRVPIDDDGNKA